MNNRLKRHLNRKPAEATHKQLVDRAFLFLKNQLNCNVVFRERVGSTSENPDVIGFKMGFSFLIECKTSRADFLADNKKHFRRNLESGMGYERYFMIPEGLLKTKEIPPGWGLIEVYEKPPHGHYFRCKITKEPERITESNLRAEISYLVSAIRRIEVSMVVFVEESGGQNEYR